MKRDSENSAGQSPFLRQDLSGGVQVRMAAVEEGHQIPVFQFHRGGIAKIVSRVVIVSVDIVVSREFSWCLREQRFSRSHG